MTKAISRFLSEEAGADLIEYALLAALVSLAATLSLTNVGTSIGGLYNKVHTKISAIDIP